MYMIHLLTKAKKSLTNKFFDLRSCIMQIQEMKGRQFKSFNHLSFPIDRIWPINFIKARIPANNYENLQVNTYSVFGPAFLINLTKGDLNIFFTGENLNFPQYEKYNDYGFKRGIDLALGFEYINRPDYLRFPLWLHYIEPIPTSHHDVIHACKRFSHFEVQPRKKNICLVASHDKNGIRAEIMDGLASDHTIDSGGSFRNNTSELKIKFKDNKLQFLKQYNFNICPENSDSPGYVTEKLFQAIQAGCIPIYWGSGQNPEPEVLNHDAILFWEQGTDNSKVIHQIQDLVEHPNRLREFMQQPRLKPHAAEYISDMYDSLESKLRNLIIEKRKEKKHVKYKQLFFVY